MVEAQEVEVRRVAVGVNMDLEWEAAEADRVWEEEWHVTGKKKLNTSFWFLLLRPASLLGKVILQIPFYILFV